MGQETQGQVIPFIYWAKLMVTIINKDNQPILRHSLFGGPRRPLELNNMNRVEIFIFAPWKMA